MEQTEETSGSVFTNWATLVLAGVVGLLVYLYERRTYSKFFSVGIPGPTPLPLIGNILETYRLGLGEAEVKWTKQYGKVHGQYFGRCALTHVGDVRVLKDIFMKYSVHFNNRALPEMRSPPMDKSLFFLNGRVWQRIRRITTSAFSPDKLKLMVGDINTCAKILTDKLIGSTGTGSVQIREYFGPFIMDVIARTVFGVEVDAQTNPDSTFVKKAKNAFGRDAFTNPIVLITIIFPELAFLLKYMKPHNMSQDSLGSFCGIIRQLIQKRKTETVRRDDLMQFLIDAESVRGGDTNVHLVDENENKEKHMTAEEILGQVLIFFVAGYDTTTSLLQYTALPPRNTQRCSRKALQ